MEEVLKQADNLIANQQPRAEVYAAMAESLGLAWRDLHLQLEMRRSVLEKNLAFHRRAQEFFEKSADMLVEFNNIVIPSDSSSVRMLLNQLTERRKGVLAALMSAHQEGQVLLNFLRELGKDGSMDSRPGHIRPQVENGKF